MHLRIRLPIAVISLLATTLVPTNSWGGEFGGVEFPAGLASFADEVAAYEPVVNSGEPHPEYRDPSHALGQPDFDTTCMGIAFSSDCTVSLGMGGRITLEFSDNVLTGSGDSRADLWVFEVGGQAEDTFVEVSTNGETWISVGSVGGATQGVDVDEFGLGVDSRFYFVRLTDDANEGGTAGPTVGADIDAVGAITTMLGTALKADPAIGMLGHDSGAISVDARTLSLAARLTLIRDRAPVPGAHIDFQVGSRRLCEGVSTDLSGLAVCHPTIQGYSEVVQAGGFTATFGGTRLLEGSEGRGSLLQLGDTVL